MSSASDVDSCSAGSTLCAGICEPTSQDPNNCGACGHICGSANAIQQCTSGACSLFCIPGFADCDQVNSNGCETNTSTDKNHCGNCSNVCPSNTSCINSTCVANGTCVDGIKNGTETDVDCGGAACVAQGKACANGLICLVGSDCQSLVCTGSTCAVPTCSDGVKNGQETDVDCGGPCPPCEVWS